MFNGHSHITFKHFHSPYLIPTTIGSNRKYLMTPPTSLA
jgi:hypothetical protein